MGAVCVIAAVRVLQILGKYPVFIKAPQVSHPGIGIVVLPDETEY